MKNQRGFTLAELMAVLIVLSIIFLIIFPMVDDILLDSDKKAFVRSVDGLEKAAKLNYRKDDFVGNRYYTYKDNTFTLVDVELVSKNEEVKTEGLIENGVGEVYVDDKGNTSLTVYNETWCATKGYADKSIKVEEKTDDNCLLDLECPRFLFMGIMVGSCKVAANDPDGNLRYVGANPNNYVKFNNELWRIIGVFNGQAKIIRNDYYVLNDSVDIPWDEDDGSYSNNWATASLKTLLNDGDTSYLKSIETNDPTSYSYIDLEHVWNIGGAPNYTSLTRSDFYSAERGTTVYSGSPTTWTGAIGLMYLSDYGYATNSTNSICDSEIMYNWNLGDYKTECAQKSWLYDSSYAQWTLTPRSGRSDIAFSVSHTGNVDYYYVYSNIAARPVLFLKSDTKIVGGQGTSDIPFILGA